MTPWSPDQVARILPPQVSDQRGLGFVGSLNLTLAAEALGDTHLRGAYTCPVIALPALVAEYALEDFIDHITAEATRRGMVANAWMLHEARGYVDGLKLHLSLLGYGDCDVIEGWQTMVGAPWSVGDGQIVGGASHWAEYWIIVHSRITPAMAGAIRRRLDLVASAHCHLTKILCSAISVVVGADWVTGDVSVPVGAVYGAEYD